MVQIATLSATIRLDNRKFKRDVNETKSNLGQLSKGLERGALHAEKLGGALAERFLGGAAAIALATVALDKFAESLKQAQLNAGKDPANAGRGGLSGFLDATHDFAEGIPVYGSLVKLGGSIRASLDGSADDLKSLNEELARFPELEKRLSGRIEAARRKRQLRAEMLDAKTGDSTATRTLALTTGDRDTAAMQLRLDDLKEARKLLPKSGGGVEVSPAQTFQRRGGSNVAERQAEYLKQILDTMQRDGIRLNLSN